MSINTLKRFNMILKTSYISLQELEDDIENIPFRYLYMVTNQLKYSKDKIFDIMSKRDFNTIYSFIGFKEYEISLCFYKMDLDRFCLILECGLFNPKLFTELIPRKTLFNRAITQNINKINLFISMLSDKILKHMTRLIYLDARSPLITTLEPFAQKLKFLNISNNCNIGDYELRNVTDLRVLYLNKKSIVTSFRPFYKTLRVLYLRGGDSLITSDEINKLKVLRYLDISGNPNIADIDETIIGLEQLVDNEKSGTYKLCYNLNEIWFLFMFILYVCYTFYHLM